MSEWKLFAASIAAGVSLLSIIILVNLGMVVPMAAMGLLAVLSISYFVSKSILADDADESDGARTEQGETIDDPVEQPRQAYMDGKINEAELERRIGEKLGEGKYRDAETYLETETRR